ncbi:cyclodeaminase/cyclohydrolase family protein [Agrococcus sp. Marseille-P2731]|uniref:cyclodeaminase/cyclohydrolase family protein n=1 Tax=Agrococcus sp. Marseille-P2731 TaxID=1841862 RepID=UPI000931DF71|nr:cyclodeaminase/cyclohydrolase family protein [Agrococcus sp. Marseille-P2731]
MSEREHESLWTLRADALLERTASDAPTPGNGSIAAVCGAFGIGLVLMGLAVTGDAPARLRERGEALLARATAAADRDVAAFSALLEARGLRAEEEGERRARDAAVADATRSAIEGPLELASVLREALELAAEAQPHVGRELVSDVLAGADLIAGAGRAALRAAALNLDALDALGRDADAAALRGRFDALRAALPER